MSIVLCASSSLRSLSEKLIQDLKQELDDKKIGVFDRQWIVTQTEGINFWLRNQIAEKTGIAANLQFSKMNDIVQLIYHWVSPNTGRLMDKDQMTWALYAELDEELFKQTYPAIASYYSNSDSRRISLAAEMADLYDQYQIYRHDRIKSWNNNNEAEQEDADWQQYLWKKIKIRLGTGYTDRLEISQHLLVELNKPDNRELIRKKLPCLRFFGLAIVTPYFLELFRALSEIIDIKFYLLNPCPDDIWMDDLSEKKIAAFRNKPYLLEYLLPGNELLLNWGSVMKDSYKLMLKEDDYVNSYEVIDEISYQQNPATLLQRVHEEIRRNLSNEKREHIPSEMISDGTIRINGCYTPVREVEVLYNYLIDSFSNDKSLGARDVVVMVNDMDKYAPFIRAVFDHAPVRIPYSIADESVTKGNTLFTAIQDILNVDPDKFKSEEVLALLDSTYIRNRFDFTDVAAVRQAVREAGIFFGMGNANTDDETYEKTETWMVSWEYGLQKIMYGLCMSGEEEYVGGTRPMYPLDTAEGADMLDRIRLYHFVDVLKHLLLERSKPKTLVEWSNYLGDVMTKMVLHEDEDDEDYSRFAALLDTISQMDEVTCGSVIDYPTFRQVFFNRLEQEKRSNRYADRGVNFCAMLPMRSVPYKVVALLGMDFDSFPRQDSELSFSLIGKEKRLGDRSVRENDKHLFLESLLAAENKLYISYVARDVQKGINKPPSTLVDELMDYIALKTTEPSKLKEIMVCIHPLHVFSTRYCDERSMLPANYLGNSLMQGNEFEKDPTRENPLPDFSMIRLEDFATFFNNPVKYYFNKNLRVYYREDEERLREAEIFELEHLQKWKIKNGLLRSDIDTNLYIKQNKQSGDLPLANMGNVFVHMLQQEIVDFGRMVKNFTEGVVAQETAVSYENNGHNIAGNLLVHGDNYLYYALSDNVLKHIMYPWVTYLTAIAQNASPELNLVLIFNDKEKMPANIEIKYSEELRDMARQQLPVLIEKFKEGNKKILLFYPRLAPLFFNNNPPFINSLELKEAYEEDAESEYGKYFSYDSYIIKLAESHPDEFDMFSADNSRVFSENMDIIMKELHKRIPKDIFEKK